MRTLTLFITVVLIGFSTKGQITFKKIIGSENFETAYSVLQTYDEGFAVCGKINVDGVPYCYLIKTDQFGDTIWTKKFPGSPFPYESIFKQTNDSGFIICSSKFDVGNYSLHLIRTNSFGDTLWTKIFPDIKGLAIEINPNHEFIITGESNYGPIILKTDSAGNEIWRKEYHPLGTNTWSQATAICNTSDDGYMICGNCYYSLNLGYIGYIFMIKLNNTGDSLWGRVLNFVASQSAFSIHQTNDNGYVIGGHLDSTGTSTTHKGYVIKINEIGDTIWTHAYNANENDFFLSLDKNPIGGFIACGGSNPATSDILLERIATNGEKLWSRIFADWYKAFGRSVRNTTDGGFVLCGNVTNDPFVMDYDIVIIKTDSNGILTGIKEEKSFLASRLTVYPNPCSTIAYLTCNLMQTGLLQIDILDNKGEIIKPIIKTISKSGIHKFSIDLDKLSSGIYYCRLTCKGYTETQKIIVVK